MTTTLVGGSHPTDLSAWSVRGFVTNGSAAWTC